MTLLTPEQLLAAQRVMSIQWKMLKHTSSTRWQIGSGYYTLSCDRCSDIAVIDQRASDLNVISRSIIVPAESNRVRLWIYPTGDGQVRTCPCA